MAYKRKSLQGAAAAIALLILILDSSRALEGARAGLELCIRTVIPSLFPFFVLSMVLTHSLSHYNSRLARLLGNYLGIPNQAVSVLIPSILGGYPVGAKCVHDLYQDNCITRTEAEHLLSFCSNAGPSFLFGMVSGFFPKKSMVWLLWMVLISSAFLTALSIPVKKTDTMLLPARSKTQEKPIVLSAAIAMVLVCCWVILFRIIIVFLNDWFLWCFPEAFRVMITGILELTNGCCELLMVDNIKLRFLLCSTMLSFGGICVLLQTASVTQELSLSCYIKGKLIQTLFSFLLSCIVISEQKLLMTATIPILLFILRKTQNRYSNPTALPV